MGAWETIKGAVAPLVGGLLGTAGQAATNKSNERIANKQMAFQKEMSDTAVQRSVKDYEAAGLNKYLAYDRSASSPSGASAVMGNPIEAGLSNARGTAQLKQAMDIAKQDLAIRQRQSIADIQLKGAQGDQAHQQARATEIAGQNALETQTWNRVLQPSTLRLAGANALFREMELAGQRNSQQIQNILGGFLDQTVPNILSGQKQMFKGINQGLSNAPNAARWLSDWDKKWGKDHPRMSTGARK